ncbi:MAG: beta-N-acetylhexosaminidase [Tepidisphaeraceae bacterium]
MRELERRAARMLCVGFDGKTPTDELRRLIARGVSGVVLLARNCGAPTQVRELVTQVKDIADRPFLTCIDHEGGRVMRLGDGFTRLPSARQLGRDSSGAAAREAARTMARELSACGIDMNFAPVMDIDTNPNNPVIGDRSFGDDPNVVARLGCAMIEQMQRGGLLACAKHFPGHGDTSIDSHLDLPSLDHDMARLRRIELVPFVSAIEAGVSAIMTAHVVFRSIDPTVPATMSRPVVDGLLRKEFGFAGVVISDDLEMKAIVDHFGIETAVVRGALAGVDLFLICHTPQYQHLAIEALVKAVERGEVPRERLEQSARRLDALESRVARR